MLRRLLRPLHVDGYFGSVVFRCHSFPLYHRPLTYTDNVTGVGDFRE